MPPLADAISARQLHEHRSVQAAGCPVVNVLEYGQLAQLGALAPALEALLLAHCIHSFEQDAEPFGVTKGRALRIVSPVEDRRLVESVFEDRGDRGVTQRADLDCPVADGLYPAGLQAAEQPQDSKASAEALLGMRFAGHHHDDQRLRGRPDAANVTLQTLGRALGVTPMCARHVFGLGAVPVLGATDRRLHAKESPEGCRCRTSNPSWR